MGIVYGWFCCVGGIGSDGYGVVCLGFFVG